MAKVPFGGQLVWGPGCRAWEWVRNSSDFKVHGIFHPPEVEGPR